MPRLCRYGSERLVELRALDVEADGFELLDQGVDRLRVAGFAFDLDDGVLGRQPGEDPAVVDLDDVDAGVLELGGDRGQRARPVLGGDAQAGDAAAADQVADEDVGEEVRVDIAAAQDGADFLAFEALGLGEHGGEPKRFAGKKVGTILCGGNIDTHLLANVLVRHLVRQGRIARLRIAAQDRPGALAAITAKFEDAGVNIIEINHSRIFTRLPAKDTVIEVECEARDAAAIDALVKKLEAVGFDVERASLD